MGKEKITFGHEQEKSVDMTFEREKRRKELHEKLENAETTPQENLEDLRREALNASSLEKERIVNAEEQELTHAPERRERRTNRSLDANFTATMEEVQNQMSTTGRTFSKIIHNKSIEKISDGVGNTIVRPNAVLSGAVFAFALTLGVYLVAKNLGYPLSGFETIAAFILGWIFGIAYDFLRIMVTGRN